MRSLSSIITEENLVPKFTFLERAGNEIDMKSPNGGTLIAAERLEMALNKQAVTIRKFSGNAPTEERIRSWIEGKDGRTIPTEVELGFLRYFFNDRYVENRDRLLPEQKKVVSQIRRFFEFHGQAEYLSESSLGSHYFPEGPAKPVNLVAVHISLVGLLDQLDDKRNQLEDTRPNSDEAVIERDKAIELLDFFEVRIEAIRRKISTSTAVGNELMAQEEVAIVQRVADEFRTWITKNNPEIVDAVMRLTPAATFLGILGLAGANMTWATPIVLAMCGGEKIVELIRKLKP